MRKDAGDIQLASAEADMPESGKGTQNEAREIACSVGPDEALEDMGCGEDWSGES